MVVLLRNLKIFLFSEIFFFFILTNINQTGWFIHFKNVFFCGFFANKLYKLDLLEIGPLKSETNHFSPHFLPPYFQPPCWDLPIFDVGLQFDLNYTPVKFRDYILHGCDIIALTKSALKILKTSSVVLPAPVRVIRTTFSNFPLSGQTFQ